MYAHGSTRWRNCSQHASIWDSAWDFCAASACIHSSTLGSYSQEQSLNVSSILLRKAFRFSPSQQMKWDALRCPPVYSSLSRLFSKHLFSDQHFHMKASWAESNSLRRWCCRLNSRSAAMPVTTHFWTAFWAMKQWLFIYTIYSYSRRSHSMNHTRACLESCEFCVLCLGIPNKASHTAHGSP